ncbi:hypothetical protein NQ317_017024 [Molorchus minor]|uniref:Uncharacterized protein n=1 Tax=Molorchus minor TaxID=1323400 RepID=A0ABQ9JAU1_9CUCU|nr:hypothetical protein NQ317_017024 [Molorchus minor]
MLLYRKQNVNKPVNGSAIPNRNAPSPRPNVNGTGDMYRGPPKTVDIDSGGVQEGHYDTVKTLVDSDVNCAKTTDAKF